MCKILITPRSFREADEASFLRLQQQGYRITENTTGKTLTEAQMEEYCADAEGLLVGIDPVTRRVLKKARHLKAISKYGAGLDNIDLEAAGEMGILVDCARGTNATSVAELAIGLFFALARNLVPAAISTKSGGWERARGVELAGKTVGIMGFGNIGHEVVRKAYGLGMKINVYDPILDVKDASIRNYNIKCCTQEEVIGKADFLTLHLPLSGDTRHMMNRETFAMMKPSAFLVNTSRGELVDENALLEALVSGKIAGAASDVFSQEPPERHPLLSLGQFILTPHVGAYTLEANRRMAEASTENLMRMLGKQSGILLEE